MELRHLRCFVEAAETLHFGRAAQRLEILPAVLGRQIHLLETELGVRLFRRSTRHVELTDAGKTFLPGARKLIEDARLIAESVRETARKSGRLIRIGVIDSASTGLIPMLLRDLHALRPDIEVMLVEDKTIRLLPQLIGGKLDLAFARPSDRADARITTRILLREQPILALPSDHALVDIENIDVSMLRAVPMILPARRSRPHSHDLTVKLFDAADIPLTLTQEAEEKHTILGLVAAGIGAAIVPRWNALSGTKGVTFRQLANVPEDVNLPLAAMWVTGLRDEARDAVMATLVSHLDRYASTA